MKTLYLVRHAESEGNVGPFAQGSSTPLSENGQKQLSAIAERFKTISIDKILASPQKRAKDTAEAIARSIEMEIEFSDLLIERRRPSVTTGLEKEGVEFKSIEDEIYAKFHDAEWRHSDEENFEDLKKRAIEFFAYIETFSEEKILIVSHGYFMRMVVAVAIFGEELTSKEFWKILIRTTYGNTGITVLKQSKFREEPISYRLLTWNDQSHFGDF